jgi:hypothetical protein
MRCRLADDAEDVVLDRDHLQLVRQPELPQGCARRLDLQVAIFHAAIVRERPDNAGPLVPHQDPSG